MQTREIAIWVRAWQKEWYPYRSGLMATRAVRGDQLRSGLVDRLKGDLAQALRRKPAHEGKCAGAVRCLLPLSSDLRQVVDEGLSTLVKRGSFGRPLYAGCMRGLAQTEPRRAVPLLKQALATDEAGGLATLSAACFVPDEGLSEALARVATNRHPHLAFAAEVARVARGESNGAHIASVAPKIKESHRIALCAEMFVPLLWEDALPLAIAPALAVLRDAERHLGRWLVLGAIASRAGDPKPLSEAEERAREGPGSARAAWAMVAWALTEANPPPDVRPTVELVARLSDRPSSDRDMTFLHRLGSAGAPAARAMLEGLVKGSSLANETAVRSAAYLLRSYDREDLENGLTLAAKNRRREALRGLAAAGLYDAGRRELARSLAPELCESKQLCTAAWGALLEAAADDDALISEQRFRRIQLGWPE